MLFSMWHFEYRIKSFMIFLFCFTALEGKMFHYYNIREEWREENVDPFDELILTWNGARPVDGNYLIYVSLKVGDWSPYLPYAFWGKEGQSSFASEAQECPIRARQDVVSVKNGKKATGFQVKIVLENGGSFNSLRSLHAFTNSRMEPRIEEKDLLQSISLDVKGLSQMTLPHPRASDLCSPTSTTAVVRYLLNQDDLDPVSFAKRSWDFGFDIFGNWVLNVAESSSILGDKWDCWVARLNGFMDIYERLCQKTPVVVSVRGPLVGSALPYAKGHLLVVTGYDAEKDVVLCMDPAFPTDAETLVSYPFEDFMKAWARRGFFSYCWSCVK